MNSRKFNRTIGNAIFIQFLRTVVIATGLFMSIILIGYFAATRLIIWQPSLLYYILKYAENHANLIVPVLWIGMVLIILYFYWNKIVGFIEEISQAGELLVQTDDEEIRLPTELRLIEDNMNRIKKTAIKNEREAREAERKKNDLVVNLAHDIRTPLSSVIGYLNLLDEAKDMPLEQRIKYIGITLEKAYRLEQLIEELFEITRFSLGSVSVSKGKINLPFMLRQIADEFYPMVNPQNKQVMVETSQDLVLWGDADKLSRVFNNILKNAIAYSYENSVITIKACDGGDRIIIDFVNQGDPIPSHKLESIFERFFRLDTSRPTYKGGAGLGLAIAKEIVTAHGGTITVESNKLETVFTVVLPNKIDE